MDKELFDYVSQRVDVLAVSNASTQVTKDAAQAWKDAVAADGQDVAAQATEKLLDVLEGRPTTIDEAIAFAQGPAKEHFGEEEAAAKMLAQETQRKAQGAKYCSCEACTAASELLGKFGRIEL